jgi:hypothetical protein
LNLQVQQFDKSIPVGEVRLPCAAPATAEFAGVRWKGVTRIEALAAPAVWLADLTLEAEQGTAENISLGAVLSFAGWSVDNYVLMPAAAYNGNRFAARVPFQYPPLLREPADIGPDVPTIITDVPRLTLGPGPSKLQLFARDLSTPCVGIFFPARQQALFLFADERTALGPTGFSLEESDDRTLAELRVQLPGVRTERSHNWGWKESLDRGAAFGPASSRIRTRLRIAVLPAASIPLFFDHFATLRQAHDSRTEFKHDLSFSAAFKLVEAKYNRDNWQETPGYYTVGTRSDKDTVPYADWQIGWVGGMMVTLPLLTGDPTTSRPRALRNFDFVFPDGQGPSGFFRSMGFGHRKEWWGDDFGRIHGDTWHLTRKSGDALYFILKQFFLLRELPQPLQPKPAWESGIRACADAFARNWEKYHQFGQFVHIDTGEILVGGSASASTAPRRSGACRTLVPGAAVPARSHGRRRPLLPRIHRERRYHRRPRRDPAMPGQ